MKPDQAAPIYRSSLIRAHSVCNIGDQSKSADERADDNCQEWRESVKGVNSETIKVVPLPEGYSSEIKG